MNFEELRKIKNEEEKVNAIYEIFNEDTRLNHSKAARIEFLTTTKYINNYLRPDMKILDLGAGAGEYSLYFAEQGYDVTAVELADANIKKFKNKIKDDMKINLIRGNACDLSMISDNSFDIVMLFGPLYHLENEQDRFKAINEAKRVLKDNGIMFVSFINNDFIITTEFSYDNNYMKGNTYNHDTFKVEDFPFVFFTLKQSEKMLTECGMKVEKIIASDGLSELMESKINEMDDESYNQWIKYHFYCCEKPEFLGSTNHFLFITKKAL